MSWHTPGPWDTDDMHKGDDYRYVLAEERVVCRVMLRGIMGNKFEYAEADARLIAAAPELLEALRELLTDMIIAQGNMRNAVRRGDRIWEGCADAIKPRVDAARAAIAKAEGK